MKENPEVSAYIDTFEGVVHARLIEIRQLVAVLVPGAVESFSYGLAGYKLNGKPLVYFGGFSGHVGLYATPNAHEAFAKDFAGYKQGKGSVQFPNTKPLPIVLIERVVRFRAETLSD